MKLRNRCDHDGDDDEEVEEEEEEEEEKTYSPIPSKQASLHVCPLSVLTPRYKGGRHVTVIWQVSKPSVFTKVSNMDGFFSFNILAICE